jgi:hypothetical protein
MNEITQLAKPKDGPAPRWFHIAVAASMVISAVSALIATLHSSQTMNALVEQNARLVRASSTPVLEFGHGNQRDDGTPSLEFNVRNAGSGMARVVWFELTLDGKPMADMSATVHTLVPQGNWPLTFASGPIAGRVLSPGAEQRIFGWPRPAGTDAVGLKAWEELNLARRTGRMQVEACFCSVFQECWVSKLKGDVPRLSPACVAEKRVSLQG